MVVVTPYSLADTGAGLPVIALKNNIVSVSVEFRSVHVYTLHCGLGYYMAGGAIVKNCKARDQEVYLFSKYGKNYPKNPFHRRCRTTQVYEFSSEYDFLKEGRKRRLYLRERLSKWGGTRQYYDILKSQPKQVQIDALGKTKAEIFRNAGLTPEEFRKATVDQFYNELTLEEMTKKNKKIADYLKKLKKEGA